MSFAQAIRDAARYSGTAVTAETVEELAALAERTTQDIHRTLTCLTEGDNLRQLVAESLLGGKHKSWFDGDCDPEWELSMRSAVAELLTFGRRPFGQRRKQAHLRLLPGGAW